MSLEPSVKIEKSGDRLTVLVRQKYYPRGKDRFFLCDQCERLRRKKASFRWRIAGVFSLAELKKGERQDGS